MGHSIYILSEEELCALEDIVRYGEVEAVAPAFRDLFLLKLAQAAISNLYSEDNYPSRDDIDGTNQQGLGLAIQFMPLDALPDNRLRK